MLEIPKSENCCGVKQLLYFGWRIIYWLKNLSEGCPIGYVDMLLASLLTISQGKGVGLLMHTPNKWVLASMRIDPVPSSKVCRLCFRFQKLENLFRRGETWNLDIGISMCFSCSLSFPWHSIMSVSTSTCFYFRRYS